MNRNFHSYRELQKQFSSLCAVLKEVLPIGNEFGFEIKSENEISLKVSILNHPCRLVFIFLMDSKNGGKATFQRLLPRGETKELFTFYFDGLGNIFDTPDAVSAWAYSVNSEKQKFVELLAINTLDGLFKNLADPNKP